MPSPSAMHIRALLAVALVTASVAGPVAAQTPSRRALVSRLDSLSREFLADGPTAGVTVAVVKGQDTLLLSGYGEQDREKHIPAAPNTVYRIGSVTKQFTAAAILQLVEQGKLHLTDTLGALLPQYPQWNRVTLRQLLNHTSGIHAYTATREWQSHWNEDMTPAAIMNLVARDTFDFAPGSTFRYNNSGYVLLGMILDRQTGVPYPTFVADHFFKPLGMTTATYCPNTPTAPLHAAGTQINRGRLEPTAYLSMTQTYSAGALCMSVPDFLRWQAALTGGKIVSRATYAQMSTADTINSGLRTGYGFALFGARLGSHTLIHHGGDVHGFSAQQLWLPDDSLRVIVFTNTLGSAPDFLARNLASAVLGLPLNSKAKLPAEVQLAAGDRAKYAATFDIRTPTTVLPIRIWPEGDGMVAQAQGVGQSQFPLIYIGGDTFATPADLSIRLTVFFENGVATKARMLQSGFTFEGLRRP